ncbi:MAG: hypothetical protein WCF03_00695 [Nitrososphaeraceae archaeon]
MKVSFLKLAIPPVVECKHDRQKEELSKSWLKSIVWYKTLFSLRSKEAGHFEPSVTSSQQQI